jgi:hypothetical protein
VAAQLVAKDQALEADGVVVEIRKDFQGQNKIAEVVAAAIALVVKCDIKTAILN